MPPSTQDPFWPWDPWSEPLTGLDLDLVQSIVHSNLAELQQVIDRGGRPHRFDPSDWQTPVALAIERGFDEAVPLLLEHGDCRWHRDRDGMNAVDYAIWHGKVALVVQLLDGYTLDDRHARLPDALVRAVQGGHVPMVRHLLDQGWPLATVPLGTLRETMRTGLLGYMHDEREDGPFAPGEAQRMANYPAIHALLEQRVLRDSLAAEKALPTPVRPVPRSRL